MKRRLFTFISALVLSAANVTLANDNSDQTLSHFSLEEATITSVHSALKNRTITCEQLVHAYIDRIKHYNLSAQHQAPINAIARINLNAIDQARALDQEISAGRTVKSLMCIPVLLKDNIDSYDSPSTSGSIALLGNQPTNDAWLTQKLREAGAIILGKGTMDEFAAGLFGVSGANGRTGNVYDTSKNPGGSSSGSAAAVSANFVMVSIGTDNSGSVRIPAAFNGIVGLRPSTGLISQHGIFPRGNLDGIAGPMARTVEDLAKTLDVIAQPDAGDSKTYTRYLHKDSLQGKRIGVVRKLGTLDTFDDMPQSTQHIFQEFLKTLEKVGGVIVDDVTLPDFDLNREWNEAGEREDVNAYLSSYPAVRKNFQDICHSNRTQVFGELKACLQFVRNLPTAQSEQYHKAMAIFLKNRVYVETKMNQSQLDALLVPMSTTGSATYVIKHMANGTLSSNAGLPGMTINIGYTTPDNMPIGVELIGKQFSEAELIGMAYACEQHAPTRKPPAMPEKNTALEKLTVAEYNNLLTRIGFDTYNTVISKSKPDEVVQNLTPDVFQAIVNQHVD